MTRTNQSNRLDYMEETITVGIFEAKTRFSELVETCAAGGEILVTKRGRPLVRIVGAGREGPGRSAVLGELAAIRARAGNGPSIRELIEEGRP